MLAKQASTVHFHKSKGLDGFNRGRHAVSSGALNSDTTLYHRHFFTLFSLWMVGDAAVP